MAQRSSGKDPTTSVPVTDERGELHRVAVRQVAAVRGIGDSSVH